MSTNLNVRPYNNKELLLFPASIGDYLPKDHLTHVVDEAVDEIDLSPYYNKISDVGNPAYHPALMIKVWFYGYATKTYSSRKIEDRLHTDVAFIYLSAMQKPDFKAISEFRRKNLHELRNSFVDILQICHRLGLTKLGEISIDSKVMKANASANRTYSEKELVKERKEIQKAIEEYLEKVNQTDLEEDQKYGPDKRGNELPENIRQKEDRVKKMKQIAERLKQAQEKLKEDNKKKINLTDNDAQIQKDKSRKIPGYREQVAVDSKEQIIVAHEVTNEQDDYSKLVPMVNKVLENVKKLELTKENNQQKEPIKIIADAGYSSGKNLAVLEKEQYKGKIEPYVPDTVYQAKENKRKKENPFDRSKFIYHKDTDEFECPDGSFLQYFRVLPKDGQQVFLYQCNSSKGCPDFGCCTKSSRGRTISVSEFEPLIKKMREKLSTNEGKKIYALRKITAEPVLGNLSQNLGFREFSLRGLDKVKSEFSLMCTAHNLRKIAKFIKQLGRSLKEILSNIPELVPVPDTS